MKPYALGPQEGTTVDNPVSVLAFKATSVDTGGAMTAIDTRVAPGEAGPPLHVHPEQDEFIYVLDGTFTVKLGHDLINAKPGSFVFIPRGTPHTWTNAGTAHATFFAGFTPAAPGFEKWFMRYAELAADERGLEAFARLATETNPFVAVGPPLG